MVRAGLRSRAGANAPAWVLVRLAAVRVMSREGGGRCPWRELDARLLRHAF